MFAANTYRIRIATEQDIDALHRLADRNSARPLEGHALIGEIDGEVSAALSLTDGRVVADSSPRAGHLVANLRARATSAWPYSPSSSLSDRLLQGLPAWYRATALQSNAAAGEDVERERELIQD